MAGRIDAGATWIDVTPLPTGGVAVASLRGDAVLCERLALEGVPERLWSVTFAAPATLLFLRAAADGAGRVAAIGQGQDGHAWLTSEGRPIVSFGETFGVFPVEIRGLDAGWELAIMRPGAYEIIRLDLDGGTELLSRVGTDTTQGFLQIDDGVVLQDVGRKAVPGLILAETSGAYAAGQNADAGPDRVRLTDLDRYAALITRYAQPPHMVEATDRSLWVCSWVNGGAWVQGYRPSEIPWGNETVTPPEPEPPEPEPVKPPKITIESFTPSSGVAPLAVVAIRTIQPESGPVTELHWLERVAGTAAWIVSAVNPPEDPDHTYQFAAGDHELGLRARGPGGQDQTGTPRVVHVTAAPEPEPKPPEPPQPIPPELAGVATGFVCADGVSYLCADLGLDDLDGTTRLVADRPAQGSYETFDVITLEGGDVALRAHANGRYVHAHMGGGHGLYADRDAIHEDERFTLEPVAGMPNAYGIQTRTGHYLCAEDGGGGIVVANREGCGVWETWTSTVPLRPESGGGVPVTGEVYAGGLRQRGDECYVDAVGPVLPMVCHYGDGLSKYLRDPGHVRANLDRMRSHGYGAVRTWSCLGGSYWAGREVGPAHQGEGYWHAVTQFCDELKARGMGWFLTQGDCYPETIGSDARGFFRRLGQTVRPYAAQIALFEVANESRDTTPGPWDASTCATMASEFHAACPEVTIRLLSAFTGHEDVAITNDYSRDPATAFTVHGYRGGHWWDKVRHIMSFVYEQKPKKRLGWQGEPTGPGSAVSVTENAHELTDGPLMAMACMALMTRQAWVYFCGPGVKSDEGETFEQMAGFARVPSVVGMLPADLMAWNGAIFHGGDTWASQRMFAPHGETRCDHVTNGDGRVVCLIYGPTLDYEHVRGTIDVTHDLDGAATLILGHY